MSHNHTLDRWLALGTVGLFARLTHSDFLWVEESYPYAGTVQLGLGKLPYWDYFYDKPPIPILAASIWNGSPGFPHRIAGALYVLACCLLIHHMARTWSPSAAKPTWWPAVLLATGLTFYIPAAVMPLAPDLLMVLPHLAAIHFARQRRPVWSGLCLALALWTNSKALLVALACALWSPAAAALGLALGATQLLIPGNWEQVWVWGFHYSADTFVTNPIAEGLRRTLNWTGFHAAAVLGTAAYFYVEWNGKSSENSPNRSDRLRTTAWLLLSLAGVAGGMRFFPRYYFQLLPVVCLLGGLGIARLQQERKWIGWAAALLLAIPIARFGPRYVDLALHGEGNWADTALNRDSRAVSSRILKTARATDTILVWGYRPDILVYTRLPLDKSAPYLDSQPLTGVLADRHLTSSKPTFPDLAAANRQHLGNAHPTWLVDGLGPINPALAVAHYTDLKPWMAGYREAFRTATTIVYHRQP
jgi:hypothetical protein